MTPQTYKVNVEHFDRFIDEFGVQVEENSGNKSSKPSDYQALFVDKNNDDNFMLGIKFTRSCIKLYSDFYSSDMIVASPLKLHDKIAKAEINNEIDVDYLSSIEVLIIDHADLITMQNWAFLSSVLDHLNCIPSKQHGTDIMRIRKWYLEGYARLYRQTIVLSYYVNPDINGLFNHQCVNYQGKVKLVCKYKGVLPKVLLQVRQIYERFEASSLEDADDARLEYFTKKVWQIAPFLIYGTFNRVSSGGLCIQIGWSYLHAALAAYMPFYLYINRIHKDKWTCKQAMLHVNNPPIQIVVYIRPMQSACRIWNLTC
uniref:Uncharacterized protein MANES_17G002500 n=1 Tax=Rhizophora mucronata TaxID=61149 RepID=A0A2P2MEK7_RHIMU